MALHKPVLLEESLALLALRAGETAVDATLGSGGHTRRMAEAVGPAGRILAIDQDPAAIERCREWARDYPQVTLVRSNFTGIARTLFELNLERIDAVLIDTGFSSDQLEDPGRGLSFEREGPLDMRLDPDGPVRASDLIRDLSQGELEVLFREYGGEFRAAQFARVICQSRAREPIETTGALVRVLAQAVPRSFSAPRGRRPKQARRHFATKIFQALRMAVNGELENLEKGLKNFWDCLNYSGRMAVISFHSLEDRVVKRFFRAKAECGEAELLSKKPVGPSPEERRANPRSRSAKLRGMRKR